MKVLSIILGALLIVGGVYCAMSPIATFGALAWLIGLAMVVDGISSIFVYIDRKKMGLPGAWTLIGAIVSIMLGAIILGSEAMQFAIDSFLAYLLAFWLVISGICRIAAAFDLRTLQKSGAAVGGSWGFVLVMGILVTIMGALCVAQPLIAVVSVGIIMGASIASAGVACISLALSI